MNESPSQSIAVDALSALAQHHRLAVFRLLVRAGRDGLAAGVIAQQAGVSPSTLSSHLAILAQAGLVASRREGRSIVYCAQFDAMRRLLQFLVADCCGGRPEICGVDGVLHVDFRPAA